ncbi:rod shape-determining protein MreD [Sphingomonas sp. ID0503]|uniref:rod shape-determining protein MreD n=1 Tax=Sphingomonas sp. ID0503 TaxID=3399691 RepID=UPI003AFA7169
MIAPRSADPYRLPFRVAAVPVATTILGSATSLLPVVTSWAMLPPFGLLMLLGWRLLRPEIWQAWVALPLGLADDILTGRPIGTGMALWTMVLLAIDYSDTRLLWRNHWQEWGIVAVAVLFVTAGDVVLGWMSGADSSLRAVLPACLAGILLFPSILRLCARLDRWRLAR